MGNGIGASAFTGGTSQGAGDNAGGITIDQAREGVRQGGIRGANELALRIGGNSQWRCGDGERAGGISDGVVASRAHAKDSGRRSDGVATHVGAGGAGGANGGDGITREKSARGNGEASQ